MPNRLAQETSPYLLQHAENPVDWFAWGPEALAKAEVEDKPIFLSIGYSACHWCHVMEHESFENREIASYLNQNFVSIKVDREERPDLDQVYMHAVMALRGGQGGWPLSAFLTPKLEVFFGGTYWPPRANRGMPGFDHVLRQVAKTYRTRRADVDQQAHKLTQYLTDSLGKYHDDGQEPECGILSEAATQLDQAFDDRFGGFGQAPKFPHAMDLQLLLRLSRRWPEEQVPSRQRLKEMVRLNLDAMARGGIYDQLGGGFARYSVDERWLVPHFEKMLYDNALLMSAYLDAFLLQPEARDEQVIRETADFVLRELTDSNGGFPSGGFPSGGFHSTLDADSEGEEGKYYVWKPVEIEQILGKDEARRFMRCYGVSEEGNFEGANILHAADDLEAVARDEGLSVSSLQAELAASRQALLESREQRVRPGKDDKVLISWNGLMIDALARAGMILDEPRYREAAAAAARFIHDHCRNQRGQLFHSYRRRPSESTGFLEDYGNLTNALVTLYQATFDPQWIEWSVELADQLLEDFLDAESGGFFFTSHHQETLIARAKDFQDSSVPSGNAMAVSGLLRLAALTGRSEYQDAAVGAIRAGRGLWQRSPMAAAQMLLALETWQEGITELVLVPGGSTEDVTAAQRLLQLSYLPNGVVAFGTAHDHKDGPLADLFAGREPHSEGPALYVCRGFSCQQPAIGLDAISRKIDKLRVAAPLPFG